MKRSGIRRSTPDKIREWQTRSKGLRARNRIKPSRLTDADIQARRLIREIVFRRDNGECQLAGLTNAGKCFGPLTPHHRLKASQGGGYTEANLVAACSHHNEMLESDADFGRAGEAAGHVIRSWDERAEALK